MIRHELAWQPVYLRSSDSDDEAISEANPDMEAKDCVPMEGDKSTFHKHERQLLPGLPGRGCHTGQLVYVYSRDNDRWQIPVKVSVSLFAVDRG